MVLLVVKTSGIVIKRVIIVRNITFYKILINASLQTFFVFRFF